MENHIQAPICNFNNIMIEISSNLHKTIFDIDISKLNNLDNVIFTDRSIVMFNLIKLFYHDDEMYLRILRPIQKNELTFLANIEKHFFDVHLNFMRYIQMYNKIVMGYDAVPIALVDQIIQYIQKQDFQKGMNFSVPYKNKILKNCKNVDNDIYNFELIIKFNDFDGKHFHYKIEKVYSSGLNQNNSLNNLKYIEKEKLCDGEISYHNASDFVKNLFYYGQL